MEDFESRNKSVTYNFLKAHICSVKGARAKQGDQVSHFLDLKERMSNSRLILVWAWLVPLQKARPGLLFSLLFCQHPGEVSVSRIHILQGRNLRL